MVADELLYARTVIASVSGPRFVVVIGGRLYVAT